MTGVQTCALPILDAAKTSANMLIKIIERQTNLENINHNLGLVTFTDDAETKQSLTSRFDDVKKAINSLSPQNSTNLGAGLEKAMKQHVFLRQDTERIIILLSDGQSNTGLSNEEIIHGPVAEARRVGVKIYTVGFGDKSNLDEDFLRRVADSTNGQYKYANRTFELENIYIGIRQKYIGKTIASFKGKVSAIKATKNIGVIDLSKKVGELHGILNWYGAPLNAKLIDPDGVEVDDSYIGASLFNDKKPNYYVIRNPKPGLWLVAVKKDNHNQALIDENRSAGSRVSEYNMMFSVRKKSTPLNDYPFILMFVTTIAGFSGLIIYLTFRRKFIIEKLCPTCGRVNLITENFCMGCGIKVKKPELEKVIN